MNTSIVKQRVADFREALLAGIDGIVRASEIYVAAIDEDPQAAEMFSDQCADWVPASAWGQFEAVGRKWMHPRLIMGGMADRKKASHIKRLPYSLQERVFKRERFPLLVSNGETINVDMMEATADQVAQLCDGSTIRTPSAQRAYIEAQSVYVSEHTEPMPYTIRDGHVSFRRGVTMTRGEVKRLLQEM